MGVSDRRREKPDVSKAQGASFIIEIVPRKLRLFFVCGVIGRRLSKVAQRRFK